MRRIIYIHQQPKWPNFTWRNEEIQVELGKLRNKQGRILGKMQAMGFKLREEALLKTLTLDIQKTSEIEGELLNSDQVRSSLARKLGLHIGGMVRSDRNVDGVVEMMLDATQQYHKPLTKKRLCEWQKHLFPLGKSGNFTVRTGQYRKDETGPMQVISGALGKERVHFEAPPAVMLNEEMATFLKWFNTNHDVDLVLKAALAHLWFVTLHPFEDGNGRIARALTDMLLARADESTQRFYSMSAQIRLQRNQYYDMLERTQQGKMNVTLWLQWFMQCLMDALLATDQTLDGVLRKGKFWETHATTVFNNRQQQMLNKLLDAFEGNLTSSKWAKLTKSSPDTALRDIQDLVHKKVLRKTEGGGRNTSYEVVM
ncbi:MAG: Fic family protein [Bacteroidota bacterium]